MALYDQPAGSYSDTTLNKVVISDAIFLIDDMDTPVVAKFGLNSAREKFQIAMDGKKIELLEDAYASVSSTANHATTITTSTLSITMSDASYFQPGFIIQIDSEYMVIDTVNVSTQAVTVYNRTYGGTNATHAKTSTVYIVGMAREEGADTEYLSLPAVSNPYNYTSIFQKAVKTTRTQAAIAHYAISDYHDYQVNKAIPELTRWLERAFFHSQRQAGTAITNTRSMGGVGTFVTTNSSSITTTITKASVDNLAATIMEAGAGHPDTLILPIAAAKNLRNLIDSSSFVQVGQENTMFGMRPIVRINTQFYENIQLLVTRHCPAKKGYMLDSRKVGFYELDPFSRFSRAPGGDYVIDEVIGEYSLLIANNAAHGYITTSAAAL